MKNTSNSGKGNNNATNFQWVSFFFVSLVSEIKIKKLCWRQSEGERERERGGNKTRKFVPQNGRFFLFLKIRRAASENWHVPRQLERESKIERGRER